MRKNNQPPGDNNANEWQQFLQQVKPLPVHARAQHGAPAAASSAKQRPMPISFEPASAQRKQPPRVQVFLAPAEGRGWQLDKSTLRGLRVGRVPLEARLDLHGLTQHVAQQRLLQFLVDAQRLGLRCVLVITGKGQPGPDETTGILRRQLPRWLGMAKIAPLIIGFNVAAPRHGGSGAFYILLRRVAEKN